MQTTIITRDNVATVTRASLTRGQVFKYVKDGVLGAKLFAALGNSSIDDRMYSINLDNGELSTGRSGVSGSKPVAVVGAFDVNIVEHPSKAKNSTSTRGALETGDAFTVAKSKAAKAGKPSLYVHLGNLSDGRLLSFNAATQELAITANTKSAVNVVGWAKIDAKVAA